MFEHIRGIMLQRICMPIALHISDSTIHILHRPSNQLWDAHCFGEFPFHLQQGSQPICRRVLMNFAPLSFIYSFCFNNELLDYSAAGCCAIASAISWSRSS